MNASQGSSAKTWIIAVVLLLVGVFIGLVVLGWGLFPVHWEGGTLESVDPAIREEYLRMAIDSYTLTPDADLAIQRYDSLGMYKEQTLSAINASPGDQSPDEIESFASAVGVEDVAALPTPQSEQSAIEENPLNVGWLISRPIYAAVVCLLCLLVLGIMMVGFILINANRRRKKPEEPELLPSIETTEIPDAYATVPLETTLESQQEYTPSYTMPEQPQDETAEEVWVDVDEEELLSAEPDWMKTAAEEESPITAAGVSSAFLVGAAAQGLSEEETSVETESELSLEEESEELKTEELHEISSEGPISEFEPDQPIVEEAGEDVVSPTTREITPEEPQIESEAAPTVIEESGAPEETENDTRTKFVRPLEYIEGIGPTYAKTLNEIGITTPVLLLRGGATRKGRREIGEKSGISEKLILKWVNHVDLYRIRGIGSEYADLLEQAGVDTVVELATRNAEHLHTRLVEINEEKHLVRKLPVLIQVESWIEQAKILPRAVEY